MKIAWILGWGVPTAWFAEVVARAAPSVRLAEPVGVNDAGLRSNPPISGGEFPGSPAVNREPEHAFIAANSRALTRLEDAGACDVIVGYSLGSLLLLQAATQLRPRRRVVLLAPIFGFAREEGLGGRVARTQVRVLARWLRRDPAGALRDFYARAGLDCSPAAVPLTAVEDLTWGLDRLMSDRVDPSLPDGWRAFCGAEDPLLDAAKLRSFDRRITVVEGAGHHPLGLIAAAQEALG